jgi:hypothetical protein
LTVRLPPSAVRGLRSVIKFLSAMPQRQVTIQGNAEHTIIITGDNNQVHLGHQGGFVFRLLDEAFRQAQATGQPADFYNGARPNWRTSPASRTPRVRSSPP